MLAIEKNSIMHPNHYVPELSNYQLSCLNVAFRFWMKALEPSTMS